LKQRRIQYARRERDQKVGFVFPPRIALELQLIPRASIHHNKGL
jgi:hypothetical protein